MTVHGSLYSFCPHCAAPLEAYGEDDVERRRCSQCGWIQYRNPTVGVAVIVRDGSQLLIGRRHTGGWCIPCGHVEWNESIEQAAVREFLEETGIHVELSSVFRVKSNLHDPERQTVGIWFRGKRVSGHLRPGGDLVEVALTELNDLPELIFPTDREVVAELQRSG